MSLRSMTGHGRGHAIAGGLRVAFELSSVNRKQLDVQLNLPPAIRGLESRIQEAVAGAISRGRVTVQVFVHGSIDLSRDAIHVNHALAKAYADALRGTAKKLQLRDDLGISEVARLPGVLRIESLEGDSESVWPLVERAMKQALAAFQRMREREGRALRADLLKRVDLLERLAEGIERQGPHVAKRYRDTLRERLAKAGLELPAGDEKLEREIVLFADRSDISEELTRLASHLAQARKLLAQAEPSGRSLDFLAQELFREINTIGSKASDAAIAGQVIQFKTELERIREQVQNVE